MEEKKIMLENHI